MSISTSIILVVAIVAPVLVALGYYACKELYHRHLLKKLQRLELPQSSPSTVHLEECERFGWLVDPEVQYTLRELEQLGFLQAGTFRIVEMPGLHVVGLVHPQLQFLACLYSDTNGTAWVDISAMSVDGEMITTSNSLSEELLQADPQHALYVDKSWSVVELFAQQNQRTQSKTLRSFKGFSFDELFVQAFAKDMKRLNEGGGVISKKVFSRQQELVGEVLDDAELEELYAAYVYRNGVLRLHEECRRAFVQESFLDTLVFPEETLIAIHEHIPGEMLADFLVEQLSLEKITIQEAEKLLPHELQVQARFACVNESLPDERKAIYLGEVVNPVAAHIYASPAKL